MPGPVAQKNTAANIMMNKVDITVAALTAQVFICNGDFGITNISCDLQLFVQVENPSTSMLQQSNPQVATFQ